VTPAEAKQILLLHRSTSNADDVTPEIAEALAIAERDPALRQWLQGHRELQRAVTQSLRGIQVPPGLARQIVERAPIILFPWWRRFPTWAAAAAIFLAFFIAVFEWNRHANTNDNAANGSFPTFRSRMVRSVLRQYQMDIVTNHMPAIRQFLNTNQAPANYVLPAGLTRLPPRGAGLQSWQRERVAMVCLDTGGNGTAILFVVDANSVTNPPPKAPEFQQVSKLMTASWTDGDRAYLLMIDNSTVDRRTLEELF
jgi:hypothetical protein